MKTDIIHVDAFANMSKSELIQAAVLAAETEIENGQIEPLRMTVKLKKAVEFINQYLKTIETHAFDDHHVYNMKTVNIENAMVSLKHGYPMLDYEQDLIYEDLKNQLKQRKDLLDLRFKSDVDIYDSDGVAVPKVQVKKETKDSLNIKY